MAPAALLWLKLDLRSSTKRAAQRNHERDEFAGEIEGHGRRPGRHFEIISSESSCCASLANCRDMVVAYGLNDAKDRHDQQDHHVLGP